MKKLIGTISDIKIYEDEYSPWITQDYNIGTDSMAYFVKVKGTRKRRYINMITAKEWADK